MTSVAGFLLVKIAGAYADFTSWKLAVAVGALVALGVLQFPISLRRVTGWTAYLVLAAQVFLVCAPYLVLGGNWGAVEALLVTSVLLIFAAPVSWMLVAAIAIGEYGVRAGFAVDSHGLGPYSALWTTLATLANGLSLYAVTWLANLVRQTEAAQGRLAALEVAEERLQVARALRAVLGAQLSSVIHRARRIAATEPDPARAEIADLIGTARCALAEVRTVSDGFRARTLAEEVAAASTVLSGAGVETRVEVGAFVLPEAADAALAALLRAVVLEVLRHGTPGRCLIQVDTAVRLRVTFEGLPGSLERELREDSERIADLGGTLTVEGLDIDARIPAGRRTHKAQVAGPLGAAPWIAWAVLILIEVNYGDGMALLIIWLGPRGPALAVAVVAACLSSALQLYQGFPRRNTSPPAWKWALILQAVAVAVLITVAGYPGLNQTPMLAGTVLVRLRPPWSWLPAVLILAPITFATDPTGDDLGGHLYRALASATTAIVIYSLCVLPIVARRLDDAQRRLARMAVLQERLRVARDLHDLVGFRLSAVVVKSELINRLIAMGSDAVPRHLAELTELAEQALTDVAVLTSADGESATLSLAEEAETARSVLSAAGIEISLILDARPMPTEAGSVLAVVLREAATNVVRHSRAKTCEISTLVDDRTVRLRVSNDGAAEATAGRQGTGLANLAARAESAGGRLTTSRDGGRFTLVAELPVLTRQVTV
ncbi:hypothetical protein KV557_22785 [Kitasatospora aureofaciens]|uniref:sensor histidine kinase n=1 Tax=Kitasatospora aureofaciens TaxID=1894 RepID=UPI001C486C63|nr:histidine kinase [Kitasatospora aureofaciens]MBV6699891.1 hypothetical protein [Kitasatospora aureofaciens]